MIKLLSKSSLSSLISHLKDRGYTVVAPTLREGVIWLGEIEDAGNIPKGVWDEQERGYYRTYRGDGETYFGYTHGPNSIKEFLHPPRMNLLIVKPDLSQEVKLEEKRYAFLGIRGCDLKAVRILDRVFSEDTYYKSLRDRIFILAVNCTKPAPTCFCSSMGSGPRVEGDFDLLLTELRGGFVLRAGSEEGEEILSELGGRDPTPEEIVEEEELLRKAERMIRRKVERERLPERLLERLESPHWQDIGERCLACGNCTMVCPTCFCYEVVDEIELDGSRSVRLRQWDVCFRVGFSAIHGTPLRGSIGSRYRQWLMHKFSYWVGQFEEFGCVGCGRCITWCPVGIDITEEVRKVVSD